MKKLYEIINDTTFSYDTSKTIIDHFDQQVLKNPNNVALYYKKEQMTFGLFQKRVNQLANYLHGLQLKNSVIGVLIDKSFDMMIAIYGILKSGNIYMPISQDYPPLRVLYMIEDSKAELVIVNQDSHVWLSETGVKVKKILMEDETICSQNIECSSYCTTSDLAYIIYTSGTTGNPKGVMVAHNSLMNRLEWMQNIYQLTEKDVLIQKTAISFDVSLWELLWWSMVGASLCLLAKGLEKFPPALIEVINEFSVSVIHFCPSLLNSFLNYVIENRQEKAVKSLRQVICSGEELLKSQVEKFKASLYANNNTQLANLYGPTEATIDVTFYNCDFNYIPDKIPIGKPIYNTKVFVIGENGELLHIGEEGELCLAGVCLAKGYINNKELTDEKFVYSNTVNTIYYKTGDLVTLLPDMNLVFLGRIDQQVKIRGYRIELGEIESILMKFDKIKECSVIHKKVNDLNYLVAFLVSEQGLEEKALREYIHQFLPYYCIPNKYVYIDKLPINVNGKVDKKVLYAQI
jgi:amino acid adenylation domain-containing protein